MSSTISVSPRTLADAIPGGLVRNVALIAGGAGLIGVTAQISFHLPFTPVPLTLQTLSVLLVGSVLGSKRGLVSLAVYALVGMAGFGWFSAGRSGWSFASFGYIIGFVLAAVVVGKLAEHGADRTLGKAVAQMVLGNLVIYAVGVPWLMVQTGMSLPQALAAGVVPFLIFDAIKLVIAAGLLPAGWKLVNSRREA